jgi:hypothetical protein
MVARHHPHGRRDAPLHTAERSAVAADLLTGFVTSLDAMVGGFAELFVKPHVAELEAQGVSVAELTRDCGELLRRGAATLERFAMNRRG